jgi:hypothetical protein
VRQTVPSTDSVERSTGESQELEVAAGSSRRTVDTGFRVTEVWDSHETADKFGDDVLRPIIERVAGPEAVAGGAPPSQELDLHTLKLGQQANAPMWESIRGTRWAEYQAISEYHDHAAPVHGTTAGAKAVNRALRSIDGSVVETN